ncbi:hypothetical protein PIB30_073387 [Stylosanthes scabra]|uniref:Annexin n=1 Tax=Stylosanthes scabra TaxID=79078 RepID=A0ABU6WQE2_9FABA|nr:hypothetical protein [Stylosanthes scabra]
MANKALKAMTNKFKELQVLVEIACGNNIVYVNRVRETYISLYDSTIEEDILDFVADVPLKKTLLALMSSNRHSKEIIKKDIAVEDASKMHDAIRKKKLDDDNILWILSTRSISQLRHTFARYQQLFEHSLEQDLANCGNDALQNLLIAAIRCTANPEKHFAKVIRDSILGIGTDEESLNRAIVSRAEIDLLKVETEYAAMYNSNLVNDVRGDTSGSYENFLITLLGKDPIEGQDKTKIKPVEMKK